MKMSLYYLKYVLIAVVLLGACTRGRNTDLPPVPAVPKGPFEVLNGRLTRDKASVELRGVNAMQTFGLTDSSVLNSWQVKITREFIDNLGEQPIQGTPILGSNGAWIHSLQTIVDANRSNGRITILCPFGWVDSSGVRTLFTGLNPKDQWFYDEYLTKMQSIAEHFKDQTDVWIEVWNEPFHWNNENSYTHERWLETMQSLVDNLRWVEGFESIILVPGNEQGQEEESILTYGHHLNDGRYNLIFDLHAYEKWLVGTNTDSIKNRLAILGQQGILVIFGEVGVHNVSDVMPINHFIDAVDSEGISTLAWLWNTNSQDPNALLTDNGLPHSDSSNNFWGTTFKNFLAQ